MRHSLGRSARRAVVPAVIALALVAAACGSSSSGSGNTSTTAAAPALTGTPIPIGNDGTYSAPGLTGASAAKEGVIAWGDWVNSHGGINGHPVKLYVMDNQNNQALALSNVQTMVQQDHVVAFISAQSGALISGYSQYLDQQKIPVLGGSIYTLDWTSNPMFYPQALGAIAGEQAFITYAKKIGVTKVGSIACSEAAQCALGNQLISSLAKSSGIESVYSAVASSTAPDYTANCIAAQSAGVQMFALLVATADEGVKIADDCYRQNFKPKWDIPGEALSAGYLSTPSFNGAYNFTGVQPWYSTSSSLTDFHKAMSQYSTINFNTVDEPLTAVDAWASGQMLQEAVKLSDVKGVPTSADILAGLQKFNNNTLSGLVGPLTFTDPTNKVANCFFITQIVNQKFQQENHGTYDCNATS